MEEQLVTSQQEQGHGSGTMLWEDVMMRAPDEQQVRDSRLVQLPGWLVARGEPASDFFSYRSATSQEIMKRALDKARSMLSIDTTSSGRGPSLVRQLSAPVSAAMGNRWEAARYGFASATMGLRSFLRNTLPEHAEVLPLFITRSSGRRRRNGDLVVHPALIEFLNRRLRRDYDLETGGAGPSEEEVAKMLKDIICQALAAFLPACATAYPVLKDAPNHVKLIISGGLLIIFIVLYAGMLSRSLARRQLAFRLACCSVVTLLTFSFASQLSGPTYIAIAAVVGVVLNLVIMLLRF